MAPLSLSVVMPAFNEELNIDFMLAESVATLSALTDDWEIVVVDDASSDGTAERTRRFADTLPPERLRLLRNARNRGCHPSELRGLLAARGEYRLFICSDRQILPREIHRFLPPLQAGADLVYSWRWPRVDPPHRRLIGRLYNVVERVVLGVDLHDSHSAMMVRRRAIEAVGSTISSDSALIPIELAVRARARGLRIEEVKIEHHPRIHGRATGINPKDVLKVPIDLLRFWSKLRTIRRSTRT
jgi:glycosyltransferase involved in cell wall biosynthesis